MNRAIAGWLEETHSTVFELARHFLKSMLDSGPLASAGGWIRAAGGAAAIIASLWILFLPALIRKYDELRRLGQADRLPLEYSADLATLSVLCMLGTTLLAGLLWQSLYPGRRDYLALAGSPVRPIEVFAAGFSALVILFGAFVVLAAGQAAVILFAASGGPGIQTQTALAGVGSAFVALASDSFTAFFCLAAIRGLLGALPGHAITWASSLAQAVTIGGAIALFPFADAISAIAAPYFAQLRNSAWYVRAIPVGLAAVANILYYRRARIVALEQPRAGAVSSRGDLSRILDGRIESPQEQAAFLFILKTLIRSGSHRLSALIGLALALAWVVRNAADYSAAAQSLSHTGTAILGSAPLTLIVFALVGLRRLFSQPAELSANWIFRMSERDGRQDWLNAMERCARWIVIAPLVGLSSLFVARAGGAWQAAAWFALAWLAACIAFEWLFRDWRKMPFTCARPEDRRPLIMTLSLGLGLIVALLPAGFLLMAAASNPIPFLLMLAAELGVWRVLRRARLANWGQLPLAFGAGEDDAVDRHSFARGGTIADQEQFRRAWHAHLDGEDEEPLLRPLGEGETPRERVSGWLRALPQDIRYALRGLRKNPGFGLAAVSTLALGLGLNAAFFTVMDAFAFRPLAIRDPHSVVTVEFESRRGRGLSLSAREFAAFQPHVTEVADVASHTLIVPGLSGIATKGEIVSNGYFAMLGVHAAVGRTILPGDTSPVLVLSHRMWRSRFAGDAAIVGRTLEVDSFPYEVIGVAAEEFNGLDRYGADFWIPLEAVMRIEGPLKDSAAHVVGRLRHGVSAAAAAQALASRALAVTQERPPDVRIARASLETVALPVSSTLLRFLLPVLIAFGLTMAIPCANTANILLARAVLRQREIGIRLSLGASRGRVVRQLLAEGLVISFCAGAVGLVIAQILLHYGFQLVQRTAPAMALFLFRMPDLTVNVRVFIAMAFFAGLAAILFALAPAAQVSRFAGSAALRGDFGSFRASRLRDVLVAGQVAVCTLSLVIAGALVRGAAKEATVKLGYDASAVAGIGFDGVPADVYSALSAKLKDQPWIRTVAFMDRPPTGMRTVEAGRVPSYLQVVSPRYFELMRVPLLLGRTFTEQEAAGGAPAAVVTQALANRLWPGQDPIGRVLELGEGAAPYREARVVGVARDIVGHALFGRGRPTVWLPGMPAPGKAMSVWIRGWEGPEQTKRRLDAIVAQVRGQKQGIGAVWLQEWIDWTTYPLQVVTWLSSLLGAVALLLTLSGMYAGLSYAVSHRLKEIGIRVALGATRINVVNFIGRYAVRMTCAGLALGGLLAAGAARYLESVGSMVDFQDPGAYAAGIAIVVAAAAAAVLAPMYRASAVEPMSILRAE